jgi:hypothetical protein
LYEKGSVKISRQKQDPEEKYPICERCGKKVPSSLIIMNMTSLTGKASWHREIPDKPKVCDECAKKLSDLVDKWWLEKAKGRFQT